MSVLVLRSLDLFWDPVSKNVIGNTFSGSRVVFTRQLRPPIKPHDSVKAGLDPLFTAAAVVQRDT